MFNSFSNKEKEIVNKFSYIIFLNTKKIITAVNDYIIFMEMFDSFVKKISMECCPNYVGLLEEFDSELKKLNLFQINDNEN